VQRQGGMGFIAHPVSKGSPLLPGVRHPWTAWPVAGFTGLELWTYLDDWASSVTSRYRALRYYRNPDLAITGPHPETIELWDRLCQESMVVAIAGLDAHAFKVEESLAGLGVRVPSHLDLSGSLLFPYEYMFETLRTNVYMDEPPAVAGEMPDYGEFCAKFLSALGSGDCFCSYDVLGDPHGFDFWVTESTGIVLPGSESAATGDPVGVTVHVPPAPVLGAIRLRVVRDGITVAKERVKPGERWEAEELPGPAVYRVVLEIVRRRRVRPWIFSNPVYLREG